MLVLKGHAATPEQLPIISRNRLGVEVIRGAAGSGKTSTALLRLNSLAHMFIARRERLQDRRDVKVLVLTFNRALAGYVEHLASSQMTGLTGLSYQVATFASWAAEHLENFRISSHAGVEQIYRPLLDRIPVDTNFLLGEVDYVCGRFLADRRADYLTAERAGRGASPQVPRIIRPQILEAIDGFYAELATRETIDWHIQAELMLAQQSLGYDIIIVDEAQDFSANQIRAIAHHLAQDHCLTLVIDTAQRLYPRGFTWVEVGLDARQMTYHRLTENHRNTIEIAQFAAGMVEGVAIDDDGTLPNFDRATRHGRRPIVVEGLYRNQVAFALNMIRSEIDLSSETVAFLKPMAWFDTLRGQLEAHGFEYVELTRGREWPEGPENIALSTMHSAKGLEFDYVFMLGLNTNNAPIGPDEDDDKTIQQRRLLAMAIGRARKGVLLGYKAGEASELLRYLQAGTFDLVRV